MLNENVSSSSSPTQIQPNEQDNRSYVLLPSADRPAHNQIQWLDAFFRRSIPELERKGFGIQCLARG